MDLYERFAAIGTPDCDPESVRLVEEYLKEFRQSGIQLDAAGQERLKEINAELVPAGHGIRPAGQGRHEGRGTAAWTTPATSPDCRPTTSPPPRKQPAQQGTTESTC